MFKINKGKIPINYKININSKKIITFLKNEAIIKCLIILKDSRLALSTYNSYINFYKSNSFRIMTKIKVVDEEKKIKKKYIIYYN